MKQTLITLFIVTLGIQVQAKSDVDSGLYKYNSDTFAIRKGIEPAKMLLAANLPEFLPKRYKHVPLAIDTIYFGEKLSDITGYTERYLKSHNRTLTTVQERAQNVFPMIDGVLAQNSLPKELKYLAVIESALNNHARSRVGAVGPWQFMSYTGREMGLTISGSRDDRKDWVRSTHAAAKYLKELYEDLDDWLLVIAAYNSGPRPVLRAINRTGSTNFWDIKPYLPRETQNHVMAFVATATIFEKLDHYIGSDIPEEISYIKRISSPKLIKTEINFTTQELNDMAIIRISEPIQLELMAKELGVDLDLLRRWNGGYEDFEFHTYKAKEFSLRLPKGSVDKFVEKKSVLTQRSKDIYSSLNM